MDPVEVTARAICTAYHKQIAETGGLAWADDLGDWQDWTAEAVAALAVAVELPKGTVRKALSRMAPREAITPNPNGIIGLTQKKGVLAITHDGRMTEGK